MAFENVFGNIDFQAPTRARQAEADQFQALLGQVIANKQNKDLKKAEIEAKGNEFNLKRQAETALYKKNLGFPVTPEDEAAIATMSQIAPPVYSTDAYGKPVARPSGWSGVSTNRTQGIIPEVGAAQIDGFPAVGGADMATSQEEQALMQMMGQPSPPPPQGTRLSVDMLQGGAGEVPPLDTSALGGTVPYNPPQDVVSTDDGQDPFAVPAFVEQSPLGNVEKLKRGMSLKEYAAQKQIDLGVLNQEQKMKLMHEKELAEVKMDLVKQASMPNKIAEADVVFEDIGRALSLIDKSKKSGTLPVSGTLAAPLSRISETPSGKLSSYLSTIQSGTGLNKLSAMKESSPTGASGLGNLSEKEMKLLQDIAGEIQVSTDTDILENNLKRYYNQQMDLVHGTPEFIQDQVLSGKVPASKVAPYLFRYPRNEIKTPEGMQGKYQRLLELRAKAGLE